MIMNNRHTHRSRERGFSLIELLIVIAIIGILVGIVVPTLRRGTLRANEAAAIGVLKRLKESQVDYALGHRGEYATFDQLIKDGYLDERYAGDEPLVSGYIFRLKVTPKAGNQPATYSVNADPQEAGATGSRYFYIDSRVNATRENSQQPATATDPPVE